MSTPTPPPEGPRVPIWSVGPREARRLARIVAIAGAAVGAVVMAPIAYFVGVLNGSEAPSPKPLHSDTRLLTGINTIPDSKETVEVSLSPDGRLTFDTVGDTALSRPLLIPEKAEDGGALPSTRIAKQRKRTLLLATEAEQGDKACIAVSPYRVTVDNTGKQPALSVAENVSADDPLMTRVREQVISAGNLDLTTDFCKTLS